MEFDELKKRAGIVTEAEDAAKLWTEFTRVSERLARALTRTGVDTQGGGKAPEGMLNPLQVGDIEYHMKMVQDQLDRLDKIYKWREYMDQRRSRVANVKSSVWDADRQEWIDN